MAGHPVTLKIRKIPRREQDELLRQWTPYIWKIAIRQYKFCPTAGSVDDYFQEGSMGFLEALKRFDPKRGIKLCTYATYWIENKVQRFSKRHAGLIYVPERSRYPDDARRARWPVVSLNDELEACLFAKEETQFDREGMALVRRKMRRLNKRWRQVLEMRFGLKGGQLTLKEVGDKLGVTRERVRQIEIDALQALCFSLGVDYGEVRKRMRAR